MKKTSLMTLALALVAGVAMAAEGDKPKKGEGKKPGGDVDPAKRAEMILGKLDTDKSGSISKEEFAASPMAKRAQGDQEKIDAAFGRMDKDGDGSITQAELAAMPARGGGKKPGGEGKPGEGGKKKGGDGAKKKGGDS